MEQTWVTVALLGMAAAAALSLYVVTIVPARHRALVTRRGEVRRVAGPGPVLVLPPSSRRVVSVGPEELNLAVEATTTDGVDVTLLATACLEVTEPDALVGAAVDVPIPRAAEHVESLFAAAVEEASLADLANDRHLLAREVAANASRWLDHVGVEVVDLRIDDLEARVSPELGRAAGDRDEGGPP